MLKAYTGKPLNNIPHLEILQYYFGNINKKVKRFGDGAISLLNRPFFSISEDPKESDFFLIPHNYFFVKNNIEYINIFLSLANKHNKKIIIYAYGDSDEDINIPNSKVLRTSQYGYKKKDNEIIIPAIADDLLIERNFSLRKKEHIPIIGFCGWADFKDAKQKIKDYIKVLILFFERYLKFNDKILAKKRGIFWRMRVLNLLNNSNIIKTNFIVRKSFSGNEKTIELDPKIARKEYIENILNSDLSLAIKGDGNFSVRFYEILSLGRIPLFFDTDCVLPLEDEINYNEFILRINYKDVDGLDRFVSDFYSKISDENFAKMQDKAREAFENYLRIDKFFEHLFSSDKILI